MPFDIRIGLAVLLTSVVWGCGRRPPQNEAEPAGNTDNQQGQGIVLTQIREDHPRVILTADRVAELKQQIESDPRLARYWSQVQAKADAFVEAPKLQYEKPDGVRLLPVSRECLRRTLALGLAWQLSGQTKYRDAGIANLLTVCDHSSRWPDWNPPHFLDTAEMSAAVGIGYDWFYSAMTEKQRKQVHDYLIYRGLRHGVDRYAAHRLGRLHGEAFWVRQDNNWNAVCNGSLVIAALALAGESEDADRLAEYVIPQAVRSMQHAIDAYDPDGAVFEGMMYWGYGTVFAAMGLAAMETAMGTDFGLGQGAGFSQTARYRIALTGPTGYTVNYADDQPDRKRGRFAPCMLYLARRFGTPGAAAFAHRQIDTFLRENAEAVYPLDLVWYVPAEAQDDAAPPLDYYLRGRVPVVSMRSAHDDPNALWVAVKGGEQPVNHGHLDLGTFELQALGRRWAVDLGRDDYNLPGWWDARPGGKRWSYFRVGSRSHNVPLIDDANQKVPAASRILEVESGDEPCVEIDLTDAYAPKADQVLRRIELQDARSSVRIADTIRLNTSADLAWGMTTPAEITLSADGRSAMMTIGDDALQATLSSPAQARFSVESAEREAPEQRNVGMKRLMARVADCAPGKHAFIVTLRPQE